MASIFLANGLLVAFSGKGIVPHDVATSLPFMLSVGSAAALTVGAATRLGLPISTTHALLGALAGAGFGAMASEVHIAVAFKEMMLPLLLSPAIALLMALAVVPFVGHLRARAAQTKAFVCIGTHAVATGEALALTQAGMAIGLVDQPACAPAPGRQIVAVDAAVGIDRLHLVTAAAVSFARGLNDTPKIAALMVAAGALNAAPATALVVAAIAVGGGLAARRVANTLAFGVTRMDPGQGLGANLVTSLLVIVASRFGMPVSTTHVSAGALFGIAASNRAGHTVVIRNIVMAWLLTLPVAAICAYVSYRLFTL